MPPLLRALLAVCAATAASALSAQTGFPPEHGGYSDAAAAGESGPVFARQVLAAPPRAAVSDERTALPHPGNHREHEHPSIYFEPSAAPSFPAPESEYRPAIEQTRWTDTHDPPTRAAVEAVENALHRDATADATPLPLPQPREAIPLRPQTTAGSESEARKAGTLPHVLTIAGGLAIVLAIFFVVAWGMRRAAPGALTLLPRQVVEVLGRAPLAGRQQVHLLRCGNKLLLVSVTPDAAKTLTEITDPLEVDRLAGLCEQARPNSSSAAFRRVFQQYIHEGEGAHGS